MAKRVLETITTPSKPSKKEFKIRKHAKDSESKKFKETEDALITVSDLAGISLELLSTDDLTDNGPEGKPIRWVNNFSVRKNGDYLRGNFTVYLNAPVPGAKFVYQVGDTLYSDKIPQPVAAGDADHPGMVMVSFDFGDPAIGWTGP